MRRTQIIDGADQEHPLVQRQGVTCQRPAAARQRREAFPERRVESLNVRRLDHPVPLRAASERLHPCWCALDNAAFGLDDMSPRVALDDLCNADVAPGTQSRSSAWARVHGIAEGLPNSADVCHHPIGTDQQGPTCRTAPHTRNQPPDQGQGSPLAALTAQPQAGLDHHGQRHPDDAALCLDADLIGLYLPQVPWLFDQVLVYGLPLAPGACPPIRDRPLVKPESGHNRLHRASMGEQGHDEHHRLGRRMQPIKDGACGGAERLVTHVADAPLLLPRMDTNIALPSLASGRTVRIGTEYCRGVHDDSPLWALPGSMPGRSISGPHFGYKDTSPRFSGELPTHWSV